MSLKEYLCNKRHNTTYYLEAPKGSPFHEQKPCATIEQPFITLAYTNNPVGMVWYFIHMFILAFRIKRVAERKQADIIYSNTTKSHIYGMFVKILTGKKAVWHIRDNVRQVPMLNKWLIKYSDKIICISEHIYRQVPAPDHKKILIYGGLAPDQWSAAEKARNDLKGQLGLCPHDLIIAQIGQFTRWKNHSDFIKAAQIIAKHVEHVHFVWVGDILYTSDQYYKKQILNEVEYSGIKDKFHLLGFQENIKGLFSDIDILLHPAIDEPFGRVVIEAMAMRKPVVAYYCGVPKEIVLHGETGFLATPYNYQQLADYTIRLLGNTELRQKFGETARQRVIEKFNIQQYVSKMEEVFENL